MNVRDLGGLPTTDGGTTVPGRLLRSENLQELTPGDVARLVDEIGVTTVVDLRSTNEVTIEGPAPLDALAGRAARPPPGAQGVPRRVGHGEGRTADRGGRGGPRAVPGRPDVRALPGLPGEPPGGGRRRAALDRDRARCRDRALRRGQGPDRAWSSPSRSPWPGWSRRPSWPTTRRPTSESRRSSSGWPAPRCTRGGLNGTAVRAHAPRAETMKAFLEQLGAALRRRADLAGRQRVDRRRARPAPRQAQASVTAWSGPASSTFTTRSLSPTSSSGWSRSSSRSGSASATGSPSGTRCARTGTAAS